MDLGFFESSRLRFWLWITVPAAAAVVVTAISMAWLSQERRGLEERRVLLADLPLIEVLVRRADEVLKAATPPADRAGLGTEAVLRRLDQAAQQAGLTVRSVKFSETGAAEGGFPAVKIALQVQGSLRAVVQWLDLIQKPGLLLAVHRAELTALSLPPDDTYMGDVTVIAYLRNT